MSGPSPSLATAPEVGAVIPVTGRYAVQGVQVNAGLAAWARRTGARLVVLDDRSDPALAAEAHRRLVERGCRFVLGPYGSDSTRAVATAAAPAGAVVWNHGAAADDVQRLPGVVSVPSPSSRYLVALGRALAALRPGATVTLVTASGRFARFAREGLERAAPWLGLEIAGRFSFDHPPVGITTDAVLACGPLHLEVPFFRALGGGGALLGGVSPGVAAFPDLLGRDPEGLLAPVQWHPDVPVRPSLGPTGTEVAAALGPRLDYVAAQAYAAALIADHCVGLDPADPLAAASHLRATTFFGAFQLGPDRVQRGHRLAVIRWRAGRRALLLPGAG